MAPSVCIGDGTPKNVAGQYCVAEPLDFFHFATAPDWLYDLVLAKPEPKSRPKLTMEQPRSCRRPKPDDGKQFWRKVNDMAFENLDAWVPDVFGSAAELSTGDRRLADIFERSRTRSRGGPVDLATGRQGLGRLGHGRPEARQTQRHRHRDRVRPRKRDASRRPRCGCANAAASIRSRSAGGERSAAASVIRHSRGGGARQRHRYSGWHRPGIRPPLRGPAALLPPHGRVVRMDRRVLEEGRDRPGVPVLPRAGARVHRRGRRRRN